MKKILYIIFICAFMLFLCSCGAPADIELNNEEQFCNFVHINDKLVYDSTTKVVYYINHTYNGNEVIVPYYAANGLPYRYNTETNMLEQVTVQSTPD